MINFDILNHALGNVSSDEFATLYFIANTLSLKKENRLRIYREMIADKLGWYDENRPQYGLKKVTRITNSLVEKGYLKKDIVFENSQKSVTYYSLNSEILDKKSIDVMQKNVPLNNNKKELIEEKIYNNEMDENPVDGFSPLHYEEYEKFFESCCDPSVSTYDCYSTFAKMGQDSFNWLCSRLHDFEVKFYIGTTNAREKVAKEYQLSIPTYS